MSKSLNTVIISGRLGFDPETKQLTNSSITEFTVAVDDSYKPKDGDLVEKTVWIRCKAWGRYPGEIIAEHFKKGDPIAVTGKLVQEEWEKEGKKQSKTLVQVESFIFMGGTKREANGGQSSAAPAKDALDPEDPEQIPF